MRFDLDQRFGANDRLGFLASAEWWNGLLEHLRRGSRLTADPSTGLQVVPGANANVLAVAGMRRRLWGVASASIGPPTGTGDAQMTGGTVRLWFADATGLRTDSGIDVTAYNGWPGETVPSGAWCRVDLEEVWTIKSWECP